MLIKNEDLYDLLNVKVGDKIKVIGGEGIKYGQQLEIVENGNFSIDHHNVEHALSKLIDVEFEKVYAKLFEPIAYETAIRRMANEEETYIRYGGKYFKCKIKQLKMAGLKEIAICNDIGIYIKIIDFVEALSYEFYVLM